MGTDCYVFPTVSFESAFDENIHKGENVFFFLLMYSLMRSILQANSLGVFFGAKFKLCGFAVLSQLDIQSNLGLVIKRCNEADLLHI